MEKVKIGDICKILNGYSFKSENYTDSGIRIIRIANVQKGYIEDSTPVFYPLDLAELEKYMLKEGDLLISLTGNVGRVALLDKAYLPAALNQRVACLRLKTDRVLKDYLFHLLNSNFFEQHCIQSSKGVAQKNMSTEWLKEYEIPLYDIKKQIKIVKILNKNRNMIVMRESEIQALDNLIKSRFVEMFGDLTSSECKWKKRKLIDICLHSDDIKCGPFGTQLSKEEYQRNGVALWEIPQINSKFMTDPIHYLNKEKAKQLADYSLIPGDIAMSRKGNVGKCAVFPETYEPGIIHSDVLRLRVDQSQVLPVFMMSQLHFSDYVKFQIDLVSAGAIMSGINVTKLKQIFVHIPPIELQQKFAAFVAQIDKLKFASRKVRLKHKCFLTSVVLVIDGKTFLNWRSRSIPRFARSIIGF